MAKKITKTNLKNFFTNRIFFVLMFVIFALYAISIIYALLWGLFSSLKDPVEFWDFNKFFPENWLFSNYSEVFDTLKYNRINYGGMFINSIWFAGGSALISTFMHCVTGYIFAKYNFKGKAFALSLILFTLTIPIVGNLPALYNVIFDLQLNDSPLYLITALGGFGSNFLIMYAFYKNIDKTFSEAAEIDGATHFGIFFKIMLPFAVGPILSISLLVFIAQWNNYEAPILFLDSLPTLSVGLYRTSEFARYQSLEPIYMAGVMISIIPVLVAVILFGDAIMKNVTMGGIKG